MKFITEMELRNVYRIEPFTSYKVEYGSRLTPEARQFLTDRQIAVSYGTQEQNQEQKQEPIPNSERQAEKPDWRRGKLRCQMQSVSSLFLLTGQELLEQDVLLAQKVLELSRLFSALQKGERGGTSTADLSFQGCTGITADVLFEDAGDCFEVTEFHIQLEKGREIALLHRLRSALRELGFAVLEAAEGSPQEKPEEPVIPGINYMINTLSSFICRTTGGGTCQRQNPLHTAINS
ncbi:cobalamin adenosyltransferase [Paenibacillus alvei]|uniref:Ethanolamine utilization cobalamin adenosyltransferase n=1 Tax=Paenibacillus alvei TaxID=44250 RepID=A0A383RBN4_PAEAL|nr:cobalamin adenosyltransferase [Paenibacillus alvei]SYX84213.1 Ethanolamine utilization cobalamin adenosyltransferase [Paenibacillus alvei]